MSNGDCERIALIDEIVEKYRRIHDLVGRGYSRLVSTREARERVSSFIANELEAAGLLTIADKSIAQGIIEIRIWDWYIAYADGRCDYSLGTALFWDLTCRGIIKPV